MAENLIPEIARMLGVEMDEEFKVKGYSETFMLANDKGLMVTDDDPKTEWAPANALFVALLNGKEEIIKLPWKPKKGEICFSFELLGDKWVVRSLYWGSFPSAYALFEKGWVFRTKEEAETALPAIAKEFGVEYE